MFRCFYLFYSRAIICIPYNFPIWTVQASARCCQSWVSFLVVTGLALIKESLRVQADVRVVAVDVVQPYGMVYDLPRLITTDLAQTTIHRYSVINKGLPSTAPGSAFIELFLSHGRSTSSQVIPPPTPPVYAIPAYNKETHSQDIVLCGLIVGLSRLSDILCRAARTWIISCSRRWRNRPDSNRQTRDPGQQISNLQQYQLCLLFRMWCQSPPD